MNISLGATRAKNDLGRRMMVGYGSKSMIMIGSSEDMGASQPQGESICLLGRQPENSEKTNGNKCVELPWREGRQKMRCQVRW
jgi:hypothetical protein